jgi:hypothetical protein
MSLKTVLTEKPDEELARFYAEGEEGSYFLDMEPDNSHPAFKKTHEAVKKASDDAARNRKLRKELESKFSGLPEELPENWKDVLHDALAGKTASPDIEKVREGVKSQYEQKLSQKEKEAQEILAKYSELQARVKQQSLNNSLMQASNGIIDAEKADDFLALIQAKSLILDEGENEFTYRDFSGKEIYPSDMTDFISTLAKQKPYFMATPKANGSGSTNEGGKIGGKTMKRVAFNELLPNEKNNFIRNGGKLVD